MLDDAVLVRTRLAGMFRDVPGVRSVWEAADVQQARALLERHQPEVVVLDLHLQHGSGLALIPHIKRLPSEPVIIVLTNDASEYHRRNCRALGAHYFFDKSSEFEAVLPVLARRAASDGASTPTVVDP